MEQKEMIPVYNFCVTHKIESTFIESLQQHGLVEIITIKEEAYFSKNQLGEIEKFIRLHYDLDINFEGIEAIGHLLEKIKDMQVRNTQLQNRLGLYEEVNRRDTGYTE